MRWTRWEGVGDEVDQVGGEVVLFDLISSASLNSGNTKCTFQHQR